MSNDLPNPPIGAEVDLRDFGFMPLDTVRLRDSDLALTASAEGFRAAVLLWCAAWHQRPAGSLPNDDRAIAKLAGCDGAEFSKIREEALHGFTCHKDGRLYHPVVVEKALEAWERKEQSAADREADRQRKKEWRAKKRQKKQHQRPSDDEGTSDGMDPGRPENVRSMTGTGTGTGTEEVPSSGSKEPSEGRGRASSVDLSDPTTRLYHRGKEVLGKSAGGQITKLLASLDGVVPKAMAAVETSSTKANPAEYIAGIIRGRRTDEDEAAIRERNIASGLSL
jgi:hypothetical protein